MFFDIRAQKNDEKTDQFLKDLVIMRFTQDSILDFSKHKSNAIIPVPELRNWIGLK